MPNWIQGSLKVRGNYDNVVSFFKDGVDFIGKNYFKECLLTKKQPNYIFSFTDLVYINDTWRAFIEEDQTLYIEYKNTAKPITVCVNIRQAWVFRAEEFRQISKKYNIDIRLYGFEMGNQFCQEIEIIKGETTILKKITYNDYEWECPMPTLGG